MTKNSTTAEDQNKKKQKLKKKKKKRGIGRNIKKSRIIFFEGVQLKFTRAYDIIFLRVKNENFRDQRAQNR